ncbi:MAG: cupin domain-containing protein [Candidatus Methylacidiphilales bacterium]
MELNSYISSGILEAYCLGQLSNEEMIEVDQMAIKYEDVNQEINKIFESITIFVDSRQNVPLDKSKIKVFNKIYKLDAGEGKLFPPFIEGNTSFLSIKNWFNQQKIEKPELIENLTAHGLPSDQYVENFLAWVKTGHDEEVHYNHNEYLVILEGACTMQFENEIKYYSEGEIISIPPSIKHTAKVISAKPMLVLVQKQLF